MTPAHAAIIAAAAESMADQGLTPPLDPRVAANYDIAGYLTAVDATLGQRLFGTGERTYFGFVARSKTEPTEHIAVVRGTNPINTTEWLEDGLAALVDCPTGVGRVHAGLWLLYKSMQYDNFVGTVAAGIAHALLDDSSVTVIGHSLGAAVGTYLMTDIAFLFGSNTVRGILFASPKPGDSAYAQYVDQKVGHDYYTVFDYSRDLVPRLPLTLPGLDFARQNAVQWITPATSKVRIADGIRCAHHALTYSAALSGEYDISDNCILGPNTGGSP
jgi:hypothetical protein